MRGKNEMKAEIVNEISEILNGDYGFEIFIAMKDEAEKIKRMLLYDSKKDIGMREKVGNEIERVIREKYLSEETEYSQGNLLAENQHKIYVIEQEDSYCPFDYLKTDECKIHNFNIREMDKAEGILFRFMIQSKGVDVQMWAFQKIWPASTPNKRRDHFQFTTGVKDDVFEEMKRQLLIIRHDVDLLILHNEILTDKIKLMERCFGLEDFIRESARRATDEIEKTGMISNIDKVRDYVQRNDKRYAKKMMQISNYPVSKMKKEDLLEKLYTVERWKGVFEISDEMIYIRSFKDVENLIDLYIDRFARSEISGQEYDTSAKKKIE